MCILGGLDRAEKVAVLGQVDYVRVGVVLLLGL